jgi:hypothetical protein
MSFILNIRSFSIALFLVWSLNSNAHVDGKKICVDLYGHELIFNYQPEKTTAASTEAITTFYRNSSQTNSLIRQLDSLMLPFAADDMAKLLLLKKFTSVAYKNEEPRLQTLFMFSVLIEQHKDVLLGYSDHSLTLYGRANLAIDNCLFIQKGPHVYYDLSFSQAAMPVAEQEFNAKRDEKKYVPLVMNMFEPPKFNALTVTKIFPYEYDGFVYFFTTKINLSMVNYYKELPTISISSVYLNYGLSTKARETLVKEIKKAVSGMTKERALDFILKFTQQAIEYRRDLREKFAFPEETLASNYADCEDKAALFAKLTQEVLGLRTVALYYKDAEHINVAVVSWRKNDEANFTFNNEHYIICEPSGKGFSPGENAINSSLAQLIDW